MLFYYVLNYLQGRMDAALECYEQSLAISREISDRRTEAFTLDSYAGLLLLKGRLDEAKDALTLSERYSAELKLIENLGCVHAKWSRYHIARGREKLSGAVSAGEAAEQVIAVTHKALGDAMACYEQLGAKPESDLGKEITLARNAIIEFAAENGLSASIADMHDTQTRS